MYIVGILIYLVVPIAVALSEGARGFVATSYLLSPEITVAIFIFYVYPILVFLTGVLLKKRSLINRKIFKSQVVLASTLAISLGLIGTFVGLANMVAGIASGMAADGDFATKMSAMLESISDAMDSMSLAFLTSILGVATSITILFSGNFIETYFPVDAININQSKINSNDVVSNQVQLLAKSSNENFSILSEDLEKTREILNDKSKVWSDLHSLLETRAGEAVIIEVKESIQNHTRGLIDMSIALKEASQQQLSNIDVIKSTIIESYEKTLEYQDRNVKLFLEESKLNRRIHEDLQTKTNEIIKNATNQLHDVSTILKDIRLAMALPLDEMLNKALNDDLLYLVYQKQVDVNSQMVGYEVYLRWNDHVRGSIPPDKIIEVARANNMIIDINKWVFKTAINQLSLFHENNKLPNGFTLSINLSSEFLLAPSITSFIRNLLASTNIPHEYIAVEITEDIISADPESCIDKVVQLKAMGLKCYVDDFGSGYTSVKTLMDLNVDLIKIDRKLVEENNLENVSVIKSIINMAKELNIKVACEGVETQEQFDKLKDMGCILFQGYHLSKPVVFSDIE